MEWRRFFHRDVCRWRGISGLNDFNLKTIAGKQIRLWGGTTNIWNFDASGNFVPTTDSTYNIGGSTTAPADIHAVRG